MYKIDGLTNDALQTHKLVLFDGSILSLTFYFVPMQYCWMIKNLTYGDFQINNMRICVNPNMLFQWKNILPFGLACFSTSQREPSQLEDFSSGASTLYILDEAEVAEFEELIRGQTTT